MTKAIPTSEQVYHCDKNEDAKDILLTVEEFYMRKLTTLIPFGLNDNIASMNINLGAFDFRDLNKANTPFFSFASERRKRSHGHKKNNKNRNNSITEIIDYLFKNYQAAKLNHLYVLLRSLNHPTIDKCLENLAVSCTNESHKRSLLTRILLSYRSQYIKPPKQKEDLYVYCPIPFVHTAIESMGIREVFKNRELSNYLPHAARKYKIRTTFSYGPTVGKKIFNYNKVLNNLKSSDLSNNECDCNEKYGAYVYSPHGHVHTGKLDIIKNDSLKNVMSKGAKFRLTPSVTKSKLWSILEEVMLKLKKKLARKCKLKEGSFLMWYEFLRKKIKRRHQSLKRCQLESNDIFEQEEVKQYLKKLHDRFVIVPVDKACNNFAIICKSFYIEILMNELGVINQNNILGNEVYQHMSINKENFIKEQEEANKTLGNCLEDENKHIPLLYWTSKQHKDPYKFRFIAGASHCTNKTISKEVALALKCIKTQFKNYCEVIKKRTRLNFFWSIDNSVEFLNKLSNIKCADSIATFDFSTLYTGLPLDNVFDSLEKLIIKMFKHSGSNILLVNTDRGKAFWSRNISNYSGYKEYTLDKLLEALKFILSNTYVQFAENIFKQVKGIPMGGNASPFIADLYLAWHEYCYMYKLSKSKSESDINLAKCLSNNSRYIDDISVVNYLGFGSIAKTIYHPSLILEESNTGYHFDTFLDLLIRVYNKRFIIGIYHKVDDFDFEVINFPFPTSNIHSQVGYNTFYSQLVRFFRLCNNKMDFLARVKLISKKLCVRGYKEKTLYRYFLKFCSNYPVNVKYGVSDGGDALWVMAHQNNFNLACSINNREAIKDITRPCEIRIKDIYHKEPSTYNENSKKCTLTADDLSTFTSDLHEVKDNQKSIVPYSIDYKPERLQNPSNHCYLNSILQILHRILITVDDELHINNNTEGTLIILLMEAIRQSSDYTLADFKIQLQLYDGFFDGSVQRDALECLNLLLDLIHKGTKQSLIDLDGSLLENDELVTSITKHLFSHTLKKTLICVNCNNSTEYFIQSYNHNVYPDTNSHHISDLLRKCMSGTVTKSCTLCLHDTNHTEVINLEQDPKILMIVINRFDSSMTSGKNTTKVKISNTLRLNSSSYHLIASVHHHGRSALSGHYTSNIVIDNAVYFCSDRYIRSSNFRDDNSDSAYIVFYSRNDI